MDTSVFAEYETDLQALLESISGQLDGDAVRLRGGARSSVCSLCSDLDTDR